MELVYLVSWNLVFCIILEVLCWICHIWSSCLGVSANMPQNLFSLWLQRVCTVSVIISSLLSSLLYLFLQVIQGHFLCKFWPSFAACQIVLSFHPDSYVALPLLLLVLVGVEWETPRSLGLPSPQWRLPSMTIFHSWERMELCLFYYVPWHWIGIQLLVAILPSHLANSCRTSSRTLLLLGWLVQFDCQSVGDRLLTAHTHFLFPWGGSLWIQMQIEVHSHW